MRGDRVGELRRVLDLRDRGQRLGRHFLVELDVLLEVGLHRADQRLGLAALRRRLSGIFSMVAWKKSVRGEKPVTRARPLPSTSTRTVWSGSFRSCSTVASVPMRVQAVGRRIVIGRVLLRQQQNLFFFVHHLFERAHGFLAADEERNDHVGKHDDVAQRQNRRHQAAVSPFGIVTGLDLTSCSPAGPRSRRRLYRARTP